MKLKIITHYAEEDTDFSSDYYSIEILDEKGKAIYSRGDGYHDKGVEKVEGFLDGVRYILKKEKLIITEEKRADGVY